MSSFVTLQLTQKLDAYGIWTACVYWTIGPRVCAAEGGTVRYVTACTCINTERLCVCVWPYAGQGGGASACCTSCRSAWATPAGQEERRRAVVDLTPTVRSLTGIPRALKLPDTGGWVLDWSRRRPALSLVLPLRPSFPKAQHSNETCATQISFDMPPSLFVSGDSRFADAIRHPVLSSLRASERQCRYFWSKSSDDRYRLPALNKGRAEFPDLPYHHHHGRTGKMSPPCTPQRIQMCLLYVVR